MRHGASSSSQARRDSLEILYAALAAVLHAVQRAIRGAQQVVPAYRRLRETTRLPRSPTAPAAPAPPHSFSRTRATTRVATSRARFGQNQCEFVAAITRRRIDRPRMIRKNFAKPHQRAASRQVPKLVVDRLQAVHVQQDHAESALRALRTVQLGFDHVDQPAIIRQARSANRSPPSNEPVRTSAPAPAARRARIIT